MVSGEKTVSYFVLEKKTPLKNELTHSLTELVTRYKLSKKGKYKSNLSRECVRNFTWSEIWFLYAFWYKYSNGEIVASCWRKMKMKLFVVVAVMKNDECEVENEEEEEEEEEDGCLISKILIYFLFWKKELMEDFIC